MVRRVFVEKKQAFAVKAKELEEEIRSYLGIQTVTGVRVLIRYDVENIGDETFESLRLHRMQASLVWSSFQDSSIREQILLYSVYSS